MKEKSHDKSVRLFLIFAPLLFAAVVSLWSISDNTLNNHECLVSVTARQMLETGDWVLPRFNDEIRLQKTPLCYWLTASVAGVTGQVDEFSSRLGSAFFGILSAAAIIYFVRQWFSLPIASLSAAIWVTTLSFSRYSHSARPEMALCCFVTISMLSFYSGLVAQSRRRQISYMLIFWLSFSLAMLAKGPAPLVLIAPPIFAYLLVFRQWKKIKLCLPVVGPILFLIIFLPWPVMVSSRVPEGLAFWKREFVDRFTGDFAAGQKPFWYYLPILFLFSAPFSAFVPHALMSPFYSIWEKKRPAMWYLWFWFVAEVLIMTISGGKRQHYILSVFPAFSILAAISAYDMLFDRKAFSVKQVGHFFYGHLIAAVITLAALLYWAVFSRPEFIWPAVHIAMIVLLVGAMVILLFLRGRKAISVTLFFVGYCAVLMTAYVYFINPLDYNNASRDFSIRAGKQTPADSELVAYNYVSARTIHYAGRSIANIDDIDEVRCRYDNGAFVIATGKNMDELINTGGFEIIFEQDIAERRGQQEVSGALFAKP